MSAVEALKASHAAGIKLTVDGDDLVLEASAPPPAEILTALSRHKPEIVELLRSGRDEWTAKDWHAYFDERAAISEYDGHMERRHTEGFAALQAMPLPQGVTEEQRTILVEAAAQFLDELQAGTCF
jgi:hypothetical protein